MPIELLLLRALRALVEVAGCFLLGQGLLYLLAGKRRDRNPVYQLFQLLTSPVVKLTRAITPRQIIDRHVPVVGFFILLWIWIGLALVKRHFCTLHQIACG